MYLPKDLWSPRYDGNFFTVKVEGKQKITSESELPSANETSSNNAILIGGKTNLPAYYYQVIVYREHEKRTLLRRYSQFKWLYEQLVADPPPLPASMSDEDQVAAVAAMAAKGRISMPPGTCSLFQRQDDAFAQNRVEQLDSFLQDVLGRPGYASHPACRAFLELSS